MARPRDRDEKIKAASFFMARAHDAIVAAERARSEDAHVAFYKEAETWLYMASQCLNPAVVERPRTLAPPPPRVGRERRSFSDE